MKKFTLLFCLVASSLFCFSQTWVDKMQDPNANFYDIKAEFESYWSTHDKTEKGKGYKVFKRWEYFTEKRVFPSGNLSLLNQTAKNYNDFLTNYQAKNNVSKTIGGNNLIASATWTPMGPFGAMSGTQKSGRMGFITIDPTNTLNLWVGAPAGGLWKSVNGGISWTTNTDLLPVIGCSDLAIDPTNTSVMYLATGDGDAGDTRSIGVLKSTNGGATWVNTGLTNTVNNYFVIRRLLINPSNTQIVMAATSSGIYRTINGGTNWTQINGNNTYDLEFKPGDPNTVYAAGSFFSMSTNGGVNFTAITNGIPNSGVNRMAIAVTPADANYVYVLASSSANSGYQGFYLSTNSGSAFTASTNTLNLLGWAVAGNDSGGQGWYDLCIAVSPTNKNDVVVGGVNVWRTTNAGNSWSLYGHWFGGGGAPFTHADQHDLEYDANGTLYNANDGTIYKRTGATWTEISGTINISQIYKIGMSSLTANKWITGHQDNGTNIWNGVNYSATLGGDGMDCFYDRTNDNNVFGEYQVGGMQRSTNGGASWTGCVSGLTGNAPWVTIWKQDPLNSSVLYCGREDLFKSSNLAVSWSSLTPIPASGGIVEFAIAPSSNQVIYVLKNAGVFKTMDGGQTWSNISGLLPIGSAQPEYVCVDPLDANNAWVVFSGYVSGNKVFVTTNGGASWLNLSAGLPNIPVNCIVYQPGTNDRVYIGMDVGIYYRDNLSVSWTLYNSNLPNVPISELEISPASPTLLHASTYGRGVWVASLYSPPPISNFSINPIAKCVGTAIPFTDQSTYAPTSWSWSAIPAAGVIINSPTSANPNITFATAGTYTISLQADNQFGSGSVFMQTVFISGLPSVSIAGNSQTICPGATVSFTANGANSYNWSNAGGFSSSATFSPQANSVYTVTGNSGGCVNSATAGVSISSLPTINISGPTSICYGNSTNLIATGAVNYTWSNGGNTPLVSVSPTTTTTYSIMGANIFGCENSTIVTVTVNLLPQVLITSNDTLICLNQNATLNASGATTYSWLPGNQSGSQIVFTPSSTVTYSCNGTDMLGCTNISAFTVSVSLCEGFTKLFHIDNNEYSLFPNPTHGKLSVRALSSTSTQLNFMIQDLLGRTLLEGELNFDAEQRTFEISMDDFARGTYFVRLASKQQRSDLIKIIKE